MLKRLSLVLLLFLLMVTVPALRAEELNGRVSWVYDGDTLQVESIGKVRLLGIDTPEYQASSRDRFYTKNFKLSAKKLRTVASRAKNYNIRYVKDRNVRLEFDRVQKDKHGRLLAYVYLPDGNMLNRLLLEKGLAAVFRRYDFHFKKEFLQLEQAAQLKEVGLWKP